MSHDTGHGHQQGPGKDTAHGHDAAHGHDSHGHGGGHDDHGHGGGHGGGTHFEPAGMSRGLVVMLLAIAVGGWCFSLGKSGHFSLGGNSIDLNGVFDGPWVALTILLLPLAAAFIQIFIGRRLPRSGDWVSTTAVGVALALSLVMFGRMIGIYDWQFQRVHEIEWISLFSRAVPGSPDVVSFRVPMGILLDNVCVIMLVVVTLVSTLVHIFSMGYMADDPRYSRFFAYLSIFTFSMLGLVLCHNVFALYCFWELVGLSSYLLIGFWFEKQSAADAQKKAFLTNRVGDIGMFLGIMTFLFFTGEVTYSGIFKGVAAGDVPTEGWLTFAGIALFMGAVGKSAQFPLHIWLPDAMEGPTPVSALIHAATMVAAGVYLVVRMFPVFTPAALLVIACFGAFTALFAATIALCANDIKKVLAYSTVSQLGYMVMGLGSLSYMSGFFHLWTHAFFKACLFLGSGSVIHAVHTQDMREMGGLRKKMPITFWTMLIATLAIAGVPGTSGFTSKDGILGDMLFKAQHNPAYWPLVLMAFGGAGLTAFYMFRLVFMTFTGKPRDEAKFSHAHESPWVMAAPLCILAGLALLSDKGGWFQDLVGPPRSAASAAIERWHGAAGAHHAGAPHAGTGPPGSVAASAPVGIEVASGGTARNPYKAEMSHDEEHHLHSAHSVAMVLSIVIALSGIALSWLTYVKHRIDPAKVVARTGPVHRILVNKYYIDEFVSGYLVAPCLAIARICSRFDLKVVDALVNAAGKAAVVWSWIAGTFDNKVVDGAVNGVADVTMSAGTAASKFQTGRLKTYLAWAIGGLLILAGGFHLVTRWGWIVDYLAKR
jgi:NADH-quinone oxidoreductase subunit L